MRARPRSGEKGPFRAEQLRSGDPYELLKGHPILCLPTGGTGAGPNGLGVSVVGWAPAVKEAGVDTGYSPEPGMLRAPDVAIGNVPNKPGWVAGAPDLANLLVVIGDRDGLRRLVELAKTVGARMRPSPPWA